MSSCEGHCLRYSFYHANTSIPLLRALRISWTAWHSAYISSWAILKLVLWCGKSSGWTNLTNVGRRAPQGTAWPRKPWAAQPGEDPGLNSPFLALFRTHPGYIRGAHLGMNRGPTNQSLQSNQPCTPWQQLMKTLPLLPEPHLANQTPAWCSCSRLCPCLCPGERKQGCLSHYQRAIMW